MGMTEQAKESRAEYLRKWRQKNKEKTKEYNRRYWERKASQDKENEK